MSRRQAVVLAVLLMVSAMALLWMLVSDGHRSSPQGLVAPAPAVRSTDDAPDARSTAPAHGPGAESERVDHHPAAHPCPDEVLEANRLAELAAAECAVELAERGVCHAPVPFEHARQPASQVANLRDWLDPCGLDDSQLAFECSENPCIALIDRDLVLAGAERCEPLEAIGARLPAIDQELAPEGVWSRWTPVVLDTPADPVDALRAASRFDARAAQSERLLAGEQAASLESCEQVRSALSGLASERLCDALRDYWGCQPSKVELPPGTAEAHTVYGEDLVEDLRETCEAFGDANLVLDCSGVPCILLIDLLPGQSWEDVLCGRVFGGGIVFNPQRPERVSIWLYRGRDQAVVDRFNEELEFRNALATAQLEAQRQRDE